MKKTVLIGILTIIILAFPLKVKASDESFIFRDVFGEEYTTIIDSRIKPSPYNNALFVKSTGINTDYPANQAVAPNQDKQLNTNNNKLYYEDDNYTSRLGIDVSHHQKGINWNKVKEDGYSFAFLRIGYRGYGKEGSLCEDKYFKKNLKEAKAAGLDVGVYFYAQAVNGKEAIEEAEFVLDLLEDEALDLPVVYDPESVLDAEARTDNVSKAQFTRNTKLFCDTIKSAGYKTGIYSNMLWEAYKLDLAYLTSKLPDTLIWYADYEEVPQTPYNFTFWQYSNTARVNGVSGECDVDIELIRKK